MRLYELPDAIRDLMDRAVDPETGEITEELEAQLEAMEGEFERKAEYIALLAREAKAEAAAVKQEEDRLQAWRRSAENRESRLKSYLHLCMERAGVQSIVGERAKVRLQKNGRPSITWTRAPEEAPEAFRRVVVSVDGNAVYDAWRAAPESERDSALPEGFVVEVGSHVRIS